MSYIPGNIYRGRNIYRGSNIQGFSFVLFVRMETKIYSKYLHIKHLA